MVKQIRLLCSNCSNPRSPEFRDWIVEGDIMTCDVCGRQLRITKKPKGWLGNFLARNKHMVDKHDYVYETVYNGRT